MADANEPGAAVLAIFDQLVNRIKSARPIRSDKKPAELGFVYSQLVLGMMVDPNDYMGAWSPAGGDSIQDAIEKGHAPANTAPPPAAGSAPAPAASPAAAGAARLQMVQLRRRRPIENTSGRWMPPSRLRCWSTVSLW